MSFTTSKPLLAYSPQTRPSELTSGPITVIRVRGSGRRGTRAIERTFVRSFVCEESARGGETQPDDLVNPTGVQRNPRRRGEYDEEEADSKKMPDNNAVNPTTI